MSIFSRKKFGQIVLILLLGFLMSSCTSMRQEEVPTEIPAFILNNSVISASAKLVPANSTNLSFAIGGNNAVIFYQPGDFVESGQLLAKIDQGDLLNGVEQAKINLNRAQLALNQLNELPAEDSISAAKAALANAEANYDRLDRTGARDIELDAAQAQIDSAQITLETLEAGATEIQLQIAQTDLDAAELALSQAEAALASSEIRMPFDGHIVETYLKDFEFASPGQPVFLIADLSRMQIETTDLSEVDAARLRPGDIAMVSFDALPDKTFMGSIEKIAYKADQGSAVNFTVIISLDDVPESLRWGMTAFVEFNVD